MKWLLVTTAALGLATAPALAAPNATTNGTAGQPAIQSDSATSGAANTGAANLPQSSKRGYRYTQAFLNQRKRGNQPYHYTQAFKNQVKRAEGATLVPAAGRFSDLG